VNVPVCVLTSVAKCVLRRAHSVSEMTCVSEMVSVSEKDCVKETPCVRKTVCVRERYEREMTVGMREKRSRVSEWKCHDMVCKRRGTQECVC